MARFILAIAFVLAFVVPASGYDIVWDGDSEGDITIEAQIDCYIQVVWQDPEIHFTDDAGGVDPVTGTYDFWDVALEGVANNVACPDDDNQHPLWPWAGDQWYAGAGGRYYESADGAVIYIHSNNDLTMTTTVNGDLAGTINDPNNKIPTYFTLALAPFMIDGAWLDDGVGIPYDGAGCYVDGPDAGGVMTPCVNAFPNQNAFPCEPALTSWTLDLDAETQGTMKFLARINRHGMADPGDLYQTSIHVAFSTP
jgi:hypothetical protein